MMSLTVSTIADPLGSKLVIDDDSDATPENDVTGTSSTVVYSVTVDNSANTTVPTYTKLSAAASATVGTTTPEDQVRVAAGVKETYIIGTGTAFANLTFWSVISPYALNGDDDNADVGPASKVTVKILCT
jgi:hypothetical protein